MDGKPLSQYQEWTRGDLQSFLDSPRIQETINVEIKGALGFQPDKLNEFKKTLSKEISAFANTEGGYLFLGVEEDKEKKKFSVVQGIPKQWDFCRVVDILTSCTHPPYLDLRVKEIAWSADNKVFIIHIPKFHVTPVQAKDCKFYRRIENKSDPITEDLVRALYYKNRSPDVHLDVEFVLGQKENEDGATKIYGYGIKVVLSNKSHVRAHDIRVEYELVNFHLDNHWDERIPSFKGAITPDMVGILFGDNKREIWIKHPSIKHFVAYYYHNHSQPQIHQRVEEDYFNTCFSYRLFADDMPPREGRFNIYTKLPPKIYL